jgi:hypothetical protein
MLSANDSKRGVSLRNTILLFLTFTSLSFGQSPWQLRNPLPQGNGLLAVTYCKDQFITVGKYGTIMTSSDGTVWTKRDSKTSLNLNGIAYGNNLIVAVGDSCWILSSSDGITWTNLEYNLYPKNTLYSITYGNGKFVAVGFDMILTSTDGVNWTRITLGTPGTFSSVIFSNDLFVAAGENGIILTLSDGITWTLRNSSPWRNIFSLTYTNNQFIAISNGNATLSSPDGFTWTEQFIYPTYLFRSIIYVNNQIIVVGDSGIIETSSDGTTWTEQQSGTKDGLVSIAYGNGQYIAVGNGGKVIASNDGIYWSNKTSGTTESFILLIYGNDEFMTIGNRGTILTSPDGISWTSKSSLPNNRINAIAYGNSLFVAVGDSGAILTSLDGSSWTIQNSGTTENLTCIAYGNGKYTAMGYFPEGYESLSLTSTDGITWTIHDSGLYWDFSSMIYYNGRFIASEVDGWILNSVDGVLWFNSAYVGSSSAMAIGNNMLLVAGPGLVANSLDGLIWQKWHFSYTFQSLTYGGGYFVAVAHRPYEYGLNTVVASSNNSFYSDEDWVKQTDYDSLISVAYGNNQFVAIGKSGLILTQNVDNISGVIQKYSKGYSSDRLKINVEKAKIFVNLPSNISKEFEVALFTINGKKIYSKTTYAKNGLLNIPTYSYSSGVYYLTIKDGIRDRWTSEFVLTK